MEEPRVRHGVLRFFAAECKSATLLRAEAFEQLMRTKVTVFTRLTSSNRCSSISSVYGCQACHQGRARRPDGVLQRLPNRG